MFCNNIKWSPDYGPTQKCIFGYPNFCVALLKLSPQFLKRSNIQSFVVSDDSNLRTIKPVAQIFNNRSLFLTIQTSSLLCYILNLLLSPYYSRKTCQSMTDLVEHYAFYLPGKAISVERRRRVRKKYPVIDGAVLGEQR
jgi:hypothetical protein